MAFILYRKKLIYETLTSVVFILVENILNILQIGREDKSMIALR